jgi:hypothetical protein
MAADITRLARIAGILGAPRGAILMLAGVVAAVSVGQVLAALLLLLLL